MDPTDAELMARIAGGDLHAFGALFRRYQPALYGFLLRFLGDSTAAEDAVQEVFWRVWQYRASYKPAAAVDTWLYAIARHAALDEVQRRRRSPLILSSLGEGIEDRLSTQERIVLGSAANVDRLTLREQIRTALLKLEPEQRACVLLREYAGKSHREIAEILGCSEANARVLGHRARRALRALLGPTLERERRESQGSCV